MTLDPSVKDVKELQKAGVVGFKMSIAQVTIDQPKINLKEHIAWKKKPAKRTNPFVVRAFIYECKDLKSAKAKG